MYISDTLSDADKCHVTPILKNKNLFDSTWEFAEFVPDQAKTERLLWDMCVHMHSHGVQWSQTFVNAVKLIEVSTQYVELMFNIMLKQYI